MHAVLKMGALSVSLGGDQYIISQRIQSRGNQKKISKRIRSEFTGNLATGKFF